MECKPSVSKAHVYAFNLKKTFDTYVNVCAHVCTCMFAVVVCKCVVCLCVGVCTHIKRAVYGCCTISE